MIVTSKPHSLTRLARSGRLLPCTSAGFLVLFWFWFLSRKVVPLVSTASDHQGSVDPLPSRPPDMNNAFEGGALFSRYGDVIWS